MNLKNDFCLYFKTEGVVLLITLSSMCALMTRWCVSVNDIKVCVYFTFFMIVNLEFCESIQWFYFIVPSQKILGKHHSFTFDLIAVLTP